MASRIEEQVEAFVSGTATEYAFSAELTAQDRKLVKKISEKFGLPSCSYGMGSERRIHIFKPMAPTAQVLKPVEYSVKNTFVDGITTPPCNLPGPAHQSMPVGGLQEHIAAEEIDPPKELGTKLLEKLDVMLSKASKMKDSPRNSQSGGSTADSESESPDPAICIKNTFVHFETDSDENGDPRIIQSMPNGKFAESIKAEKEAGPARGKRSDRPMPFQDDPEEDTERLSALLFPATPNAEGHIIALDDNMPVSKDVPVVQWAAPATAMLESSITVLPPAFWKPSPAQILCDSPITPRQQEQPKGPTQEQVSGPATQLAAPVPPLLPGTPVVVSGLASQPMYNGLRGWVSDFDSYHSRYNIIIEIGPNAQRSMVKVKPHNLSVVQAAQPLLSQQQLYYPPVQQQAIPTRAAKASLCLDQMV